MSGPLDFFLPQADPSQPGMLQSLQDPGLQGALLQAGLSLMGGPTWGDTGASQMARAIGSAGEAGTRREAGELKEREVSSKEDLRASQAEAATARAGQAGTNVDLARQRFEVSKMAEEGKRQRSTLGAQVRLSNLYQQHLRDIAKENLNRTLMGQPALPTPGMKEWIAGNPMLKSLGLIPDDTGGAGVPDDGTGTEPGVQAQTPQTYPTATKGMVKEAGKIYQTPQGPMKWTGSTWVSP